MNKYFIWAIVAALIIPGCDMHDSHQQDDELTRVVLNNGEKWEINDEIMIPVKDMEAHIEEFSSDLLRDYLTLAKTLKSDIKSLTSSCTMTGQGHDELHKWLLPYIELVSKLSEATDKAEAAAKFEAIEASLSTYNKNFQ